MSNITEIQADDNSNELVNWIEDAISKQNIKYYEYSQFKNIQKIGEGGFGKVYCANWKTQSLALKSFTDLENTAVKEIIREINLHREVNLHSNVIRFCGITIKENQNHPLKKYLLVMEYADGGSLSNYLKENFENLTWEHKYKLAYQLAGAVLFLHGEEIVHRDLHSGNVLIHQKTIKLADFGLSRRIGCNSSSIQSKTIMGVTPYVDPKRHDKEKGEGAFHRLKFSDVYSIGVLFWEISSGHRPFKDRDYGDPHLLVDIIAGLREIPIPDTPSDYIKLYTECWDGKPDNRPTMDQVVARLEMIINKSKVIEIREVNPQLLNEHQLESDNIAPSINNLLHGELSQIMQNIDKIDIDMDLSKMIDELVILLYKELNEGKEPEERNQHILDYLNNQIITSHETYNWLLNNHQDNSNFIYLLGYFNYHQIGTNVDKQKAFELYKVAANLGNCAAQYNLACMYESGECVNKDYNEVFELSKKSAEGEFLSGITMFAHCYHDGIGTSIDKQKAMEIYKKAAILGSSIAQHYFSDAEKSGAIDDAIGLDISFIQFIPLIKDAAEIFNKVDELYSSAQHNIKITKLLRERIGVANSAISILQDMDLYTGVHYAGLQRLVQVLQEMKEYIKEITQYNMVQKLLGANKIETKFYDLCEEYDSSVVSLNLNQTIDFRMHTERESKILRDDIEELLKFQLALADSIHNVHDNQNTSDKMNALIEEVYEMSITMQNLDKNRSNQKKIDSIFQEILLKFDEYEEADDAPRSERLGKYIHRKTQQDFAFKTIDKDQNYINQAKNQVIILKKLKDCQNIIHFYGLTSFDGIHYVVTEWAENGNLREYISMHGQNIGIRLRIKFAYDIAKGLNFLNAVKIVYRDIRAENIAITDNDVAKITNFKSSRVGTTGNLAVNKDRIRYRAPEMLRRGMTGGGTGEEKYDIQCEVYSFGILLWEIAECRIPYEEFDDFMEIAKKVVGGYREPFTPGTAIPKKYQELVTKAISQNPGLRPMFSMMLTELLDIFNSSNNYTPMQPIYHLNTSKSSRRPPKQNNSDFIFDWASFNYMTIDKAVEEHKMESTNKSKIYKCFDAYANMGNPKAKYWKAYYITKGWSDLTIDRVKRQKIAAQLFKEAADYGDEFPDSQLRYALMAMKGDGVKQVRDEAIKYLLKAAKNGHAVAIYNVATYYFSTKEEVLGKYYMIMAADKKYEQAINYCKMNNISF